MVKIIQGEKKAETVKTHSASWPKLSSESWKRDLDGSTRIYQASTEALSTTLHTADAQTWTNTQTSHSPLSTRCLLSFLPAPRQRGLVNEWWRAVYCSPVLHHSKTSKYNISPWGGMAELKDVQQWTHCATLLESPIKHVYTVEVVVHSTQWHCWLKKRKQLV